MTRTSLFVACTLLALGFGATSAQAQTSSRAWVSGKGTDAAGCGTVTAPCRTPQYAFTNIVAAGGEIDILDPAGYGSITITHAISIVNDGVGTAGMLAPAAGNAITINAGSTDAVQLRGLTIEGSGTGYNGIVFNSGGSLTVTNCVAQNFVYSGAGNTTGNGILMQPAFGMVSFVITNTVVSNNGLYGIYYFPPSGTPSANGVIDHVVATNNNVGIEVSAINTSGGSTKVAISNSIASNGFDGIDIVGGAGSITASIDNAGVSANDNFGVFGRFSNNTVLLGRSVIIGNGTGVFNDTSPNAIFTYQDNRINGNTSNVSGPALLTETLQ
jgi:hypothetical protein